MPVNQGFFEIINHFKQKIWLKQRKAALALDFSYFQHVSKLVTHDIKLNQKRYQREKPRSFEGTEKGVFFINERHTFFSCVSKNQG